MARSIRTLVVTIGLLLAACGDDDRPSEAGTASTEPDLAPSSTTSADQAPSSTTTEEAEPPSIDPDDVAAHLQRLADRYDTAVAAILADPRVAGDDDHPAVQDYLSLFAPGSEFASGALASWEQQGVDGRFYRAGPSGEMYDSIVAEVRVDAEAGTAMFLFCSLQNYTVVDASGRAISGQSGWSAALGVAQVVGDGWRLRDLTETSPDGCEGAAGDADS